MEIEGHVMVTAQEISLRVNNTTASTVAHYLFTYLFIYLQRHGKNIRSPGISLQGEINTSGEYAFSSLGQLSLSAARGNISLVLV